MIKLLKNKEVRKTLILQIIIATAGCIASFTVSNRAGIIAIILSSFLILIHYISTYERYRKIAELASDINLILHGDSAITMGDYTEGELGILHSEIYKMTIRLREQQQKLLNDTVDAFDDTKASALIMEKTELQRQLEQLQEIQQKRINTKHRLDDIYTILDGLKNRPMEYDDQMVRQILECVTVDSKEQITVIFIGGLKIKQSLLDC